MRIFLGKNQNLWHELMFLSLNWCGLVEMSIFEQGSLGVIL